MSQLSLKKIKLGDNADLSKNFVISVPAVADGTLTIERENGTDVLTIDASGNASLPGNLSLTGKVSQAIQSMVRVSATNGYGSVNTQVRRWTNTIVNQGSDITYNDSPTLGGSFTINVAGVYSINYVDQFIGLAAMQIGINGVSITNDAALSLGTLNPTTANILYSTSGSVYLPAGSVIRAIGNVGSGTNTTYTQFTITRVS